MEKCLTKLVKGDLKPEELAEIRALIKPLVIEMHRRKWKSVTLDKDGAEVFFTATPTIENQETKP